MSQTISVKNFLFDNEQNFRRMEDEYENLVGKDELGRCDAATAQNFITELEIVCQGQDLQEVAQLFTEESLQGRLLTFDDILQIIVTPLEAIEYRGSLQPLPQLKGDPNFKPGPIDPLLIQPQYNPQGDNIYKHHNKMRLERFLKLHKEQVEIYFNEFNKEPEGKIPLISCSDLPLIMRISFYMDNITLHITKEDETELFDLPVAQVAIMTHLKLFIEHYGLNGGYQIENPIDFKLDFAQYLLFLNFFVTNEPTLFLKQSSDLDYTAKEKTNEDNSQTDLEKDIQMNIEKYQGMLEKAQTQQDRQIIENMLTSLFDQQSRLQKLSNSQLLRQDQGAKGGKGGAKKVYTKQEQRKNHLAEIFVFYCKQQYTQNVIYTFERLLYESHVLNLSNFLLFCKHFKVTNYNVKLQKKSLPIFFKKNASNYKEMTFDEFQMALEKVALIMYEERDNEMPTDFDKVEAFYKYIGVDNPNYYRKHMLLLNPPFNIQDKEGFRLLPKDKDRPVEMKKIEPQLVQELERRKKEREILLKKAMAVTPQPPPKKFVLGNIKSVQSLDALKRMNHDSYTSKAHKDFLAKVDNQNKVSWNQLQIMDYDDVNKKGNKFKPTDLFDEHEDQEDRMYLGQFSLQDEKFQKQQQMYINKMNQEAYGNYRPGLRPSERYYQQNPSAQIGQNKHKQHSQENIFDYRNQSIDMNPPVYKNYNSGLYSVKNINSNIGQNYMQRANQVDKVEKQREQAILNNMNQRQLAQQPVQQNNKKGYSRNY